MATPSQASNERLIPLVLMALVALTYARAMGFGYAGLDLEDYLLDNPVVRRGLTFEGVVWAFTTTHAINWHPLTWVSHMVDVSLFGMNPAAFHTETIALHAVSTVVVFRIARRVLGAVQSAVFVAVFFAIHPLRVESVVWLAERKDVLCGLFFLLAMAVAVHHEHGTKRTALVTLLGSCALLAKPMAVSLPIIIFAHDCWRVFIRAHSAQAGSKRDGALRNDVLRSLLSTMPLALVALLSAFATLHAQAPAINVPAAGANSLVERLGNAAVAVMIYLRMNLWPAELNALEPFPVGGYPMAARLLACAAVAGMMLLIWYRRTAVLAFGLAWFLVTLIPVVGIVRVGHHEVADRYTYLPSVGLLLAFASVLQCRTEGWARALWGVAACVALACIGLTVRLVETWSDNVALWSRAVEVTGPNPRAEAALASALWTSGRLKEALQHAEHSSALEPNSDVLDLLGRIKLSLGDVLGARRVFEELVRLPTARAIYRVHLEEARFAAGEERAAISALRSLALDRAEQMEADIVLARWLATASDPSLRDPSEAAALAQRVLDARGAEATAREIETFADVLLALGRTEDARRALDVAVDAAREAADASTTERLLHRLQAMGGAAAP